MNALVTVVLVCLFVHPILGEISESEYSVLLEYAQLSSIAYCLNKGLASGAMGDSCEINSCQTSEHKDIFVLETFSFNQWDGIGSGYLAIDHREKRVILVLRGTSSRRDWIGNFDFVPVPYQPLTYLTTNSCDNCRIHKGFYEFLKTKCAYIIKRALSVQQRYPDYKLVATGHSLGAALATLAGIEFSLMGHDPLVVVYASPRVGNKDFVSWIDNTVMNKAVGMSAISETNVIATGFIRVTNVGDLVTKLPPAPVFRHAGIEYEIAKKKTPHRRADINRIDHNEAQDLGSETDAISSEDDKFQAFNPLKLWPPLLGKYEHKHYLIRITGCDDEKE